MQMYRLSMRLQNKLIIFSLFDSLSDKQSWEVACSCIKSVLGFFCITNLCNLHNLCSNLHFDILSCRV